MVLLFIFFLSHESLIQSRFQEVFLPGSYKQHKIFSFYYLKLLSFIFPFFLASDSLDFEPVLQVAQYLAETLSRSSVK